MAHCALCRLVAQAKRRRVFEDTDSYVIVEHMGTMAPILICKQHGPLRPSLEMFAAIKRTALQLFGDDFSLSHSVPASDHVAIKVIRLRQQV